jgi:glycerol-3-phosphate dehydrogenase
LTLYDAYARSSSLPKHACHAVSDPAVPPVDPHKFRWLCSYFDAQVCYPEIFTLALLEDARGLAAASGTPLEVLTYHEARMEDGQVGLFRLAPDAPPNEAPPAVSAAHEFRPAAVVNTTGAWVDQTLRRLRIDSDRLIGGTRGSHIVTYHPSIAEALGGDGVYVEARDGRPVFILPFGEGTLIGTTDLPFQGDPRTVKASEEEIDYLLDLVQDVFPAVSLGRHDVDLVYAGVRPLPSSDADTPSSITRRHHIEQHAGTDLPTFSLIGGKLTTCRAVAEELVARLADHLGMEQRANSRGRPLPGGEDYPASESLVRQRQHEIAERNGLPPSQVQAIWSLCGTRSEEILAELPASSHGEPAKSAAALPGTSLPHSFVRWVIRHQWVTTVSDLVERRLMLLYQRGLSRDCLRAVGELLGDERDLPPTEVQMQVAQCEERLQRHFQKTLID